MFSLQNITYYISGNLILDDVSLQINARQHAGLVGRNGSGKTTLFKTVLGFLPRLGGAFYMGDRDIDTYSRREIARVIAYVPQAHVPAFPFTVEDVVW